MSAEGPTTVLSWAERGWVRTLTKALGIGVGAAVGQYTGLYLLLPTTAAVAVWWLGRKLLSPDRQIILATLAVNAGLFLWLTLGLAIQGVLTADVVDLVVYVVGLTWLVVRPGVGPLYLLGAYQAVSLTINVLAILDATTGSDAHKALLIHVLFRALALIALGRLWVTLRRQINTPEATAT